MLRVNVLCKLTGSREGVRVSARKRFPELSYQDLDPIVGRIRLTTAMGSGLERMTPGYWTFLLVVSYPRSPLLPRQKKSLYTYSQTFQ